MAIDCVSEHTIQIFDKGGVNPQWQLDKVARVEWGRIRDDISAARIVLNAKQCAAQADILEQIRSERHEMVVFRGEKRVWEGPITRRHGTANEFEINALDVMHYGARTTMHAGYDNSYPNVAFVIDRAKTILLNELARKEALTPPINVLPFLVAHQKPTDAKTSSKTMPYQYQAWEHIDELAARGGLDYTVIGRAIHLWDVHENAMGQTQTLTQADFLGELSVTEYGMEAATLSHVTDGQGNVGSYGGNDPYYGEIEILATAYDEEVDEDLPTQSELESQASRNYTGRNPAPIVVRVPDNSSINPNGLLTIDDLVPGVWMPIRAEALGFGVVTQMQKLNAMKVVEEPGKETITVSLTPANSQEIV